MKPRALEGDLDNSSRIFKNYMLHVFIENSCFCGFTVFHVMKDKEEIGWPSIKQE